MFLTLLFAFFWWVLAPRGHISSCTGLLQGSVVLLEEEQSYGAGAWAPEWSRASPGRVFLGRTVAGLLHGSVNREVLEESCGERSNKEPPLFLSSVSSGNKGR